MPSLKTYDPLPKSAVFPKTSVQVSWTLSSCDTGGRSGTLVLYGLNNPFGSSAITGGSYTVLSSALVAGSTNVLIPDVGSYTTGYFSLSVTCSGETNTFEWGYFNFATASTTLAFTSPVPFQVISKTDTVTVQTSFDGTGSGNAQCKLELIQAPWVFSFTGGLVVASWQVDCSKKNPSITVDLSQVNWAQQALSLDPEFFFQMDNYYCNSIYCSDAHSQYFFIPQVMTTAQANTPQTLLDVSCLTSCTALPVLCKICPKLPPSLQTLSALITAVPRSSADLTLMEYHWDTNGLYSLKINASVSGDVDVAAKLTLSSGGEQITTPEVPIYGITKKLDLGTFAAGLTVEGSCGIFLQLGLQFDALMSVSFTLPSPRTVSFIQENIRPRTGDAASTSIIPVQPTNVVFQGSINAILYVNLTAKVGGNIGSQVNALAYARLYAKLTGKARFPPLPSTTHTLTPFTTVVGPICQSAHYFELTVALGFDISLTGAIDIPLYNKNVVMNPVKAQQEVYFNCYAAAPPGYSSTNPWASLNRKLEGTVMLTDVNDKDTFLVILQANVAKAVGGTILDIAVSWNAQTQSGSCRTCPRHTLSLCMFSPPAPCRSHPSNGPRQRQQPKLQRHMEVLRQ